MPQGQQPALQGYQDAVCSGQAAARAQRFSGLAAELRDQLDMAKITQQVRRSCLPTGPLWQEVPALLGASSVRALSLGLGVLHPPAMPCLTPYTAPRPHPGLCPPSPGCRLSLSPAPPRLCDLAVSSPFHPDLSHQPVDQPQPQPIPSPELASPHAPFPLSWAWMPPTAQPRSGSPHPHGGCRRCWRTCWTHRKFCRTWMSSRPWPCCCPRVPAPAGLLGPQLAALAGRPTAQGPAWAWAPTPPWRKVPRLLRPRLPQTCCRASARPLCNSGPPCNPSCVATTGRWQAGKQWCWEGTRQMGRGLTPSLAGRHSEVPPHDPPAHS